MERTPYSLLVINGKGSYFSHEEFAHEFSFKIVN